MAEGTADKGPLTLSSTEENRLINGGPDAEYNSYVVRMISKENLEQEENVVQGARESTAKALVT